jgi:hypothetical protein
MNNVLNQNEKTTLEEKILNNKFQSLQFIHQILPL